MKYLKYLKNEIGVKLKKSLLFLFLFVFILSIKASAQYAPKGYVSDYVGIISPEKKAELESDISEYLKKTSIEIAIVIIPDLNGSDIDTYTNKLANEWGVGKKGVDDGIVILIDYNEHKWRIEVGGGLQSFITDADAKNIGDSTITKNFKLNEYETGIQSCFNSIILKIGDRSKEARDAYLLHIKKERDALFSKIGDIFMYLLYVIIIGVMLFFFIKFLIKQYNKKQNLILSKENFSYKLSKVKIIYLDVKSQLDKNSEMFEFTDFSSRLTKINFYLENVMNETISKIKNITDIEDQEVRLKENEKELINIKEHIRKYTFAKEYINTEISQNINKTNFEIERNISNARNTINEINESNPPTVWGSYDFRHFDFNVQDRKHADEYYQEAIKYLEKGQYTKAIESGEKALKFLTMILDYVMTPIKVKEQINNSRKIYYEAMQVLPNSIPQTAEKLNREHVSKQTKINFAKGVDEFNKLNAMDLSAMLHIDWIALGTIALSALNFINESNVQSDLDIREHFDLVARAERAAKDRELEIERELKKKEYKRTHKSSGNSSYSSINTDSSYNSNSSYDSDSYSSNSSYDDNSSSSGFDGFGGGSFDGGGASGGW
jgi:uncharacterized membrane protein YgcG